MNFWQLFPKNSIARSKMIQSCNVGHLSQTMLGYIFGQIRLLFVSDLIFPGSLSPFPKTCCIQRIRIHEDGEEVTASFFRCFMMVSVHVVFFLLFRPLFPQYCRVYALWGIPWAFYWLSRGIRGRFHSEFCEDFFLLSFA